MTPLEYIYYFGHSLKKRYALKHQKRLPHKVISIGNITIGGTGKTPAAIAIAEEAKKRGFGPIILTRGYLGKAKGPCFVQGAGNPVEFGDEAVLMAERLKDVPIVKCADRYEGGMFALSLNPESRIPNPVFILDDGFQHWRLYRDIDIVLIDGLNPFGNRKLFPLGPLREPLKELNRADIFVITKSRNEALLNELKSINPAAPVFFSEYRITKLKDINGRELPIDVLKEKKVYAFCGIANPDSFKKTIMSLCGELAGFKAHRDHYKYAQGDIAYLESLSQKHSSDYLITTEKDMVKLKGLKLPGNLLFLTIEFSVSSDFFERIFNNIP
jgi:tetraacyldisaccharide 4'-kinase